MIGFVEDISLGDVLDLPDIANEVICNLSEQLMALHQRVRWYEERLTQIAKEDARVRLLRTIPGVGAVTRRLPSSPASEMGTDSETVGNLLLGLA